MRARLMILGVVFTFGQSMGLALADPAQLAAAQQAADTAAPAVNPDEIVCKVGAPVTGSHIAASRECHSQRAWALMQKQSQAQVQDQQLRGLTMGPKSQ